MTDELDSYFPAPVKRNSIVWVMTFADLLSVLLAFFVLLYAMHSTEKSEWRILTAKIATQPKAVRLPRIATQRFDDTGYLSGVMAQKFASQPALAAFRLTSDGNTIYATCPLAGIKEESYSQLSAVLGRREKFTVSVIGADMQAAVNAATGFSEKLKAAGYESNVDVYGTVGSGETILEISFKAD